MVQGGGGCGLRWGQVYRRACREDCMDAVSASAEPEADVRHGGEGRWRKALWWSRTQTTWLRVLQNTPGSRWSSSQIRACALGCPQGVLFFVFQ